MMRLPAFSSFAVEVGLEEAITVFHWKNLMHLTKPACKNNFGEANVKPEDVYNADETGLFFIFFSFLHDS